MKKWIFIFLSFLFIQAYGLTGTELLLMCNDAKKVLDNNGHPTDLYDAANQWVNDGTCFGYFLATNDALDNNKYFPKNVQYCLPTTSSFYQQLRVVLKYLNAHPEKLNFMGAVLIMAASHEAFPCS